MLLHTNSQGSTLSLNPKKMKPRQMEKDIERMIKEADWMGPRLIEEDLDRECLESDIEGILDLLKCPICLEIMDTPT